MNLWERDPIPVRKIIDANIDKHVNVVVCKLVDANLFDWFRRNLVRTVGIPIKNKMIDHIIEEFNI